MLNIEDKILKLMPKEDHLSCLNIKVGNQIPILLYCVSYKRVRPIAKNLIAHR